MSEQGQNIRDDWPEARFSLDEPESQLVLLGLLRAAETTGNPIKREDFRICDVENLVVVSKMAVKHATLSTTPYYPYVIDPEVCTEIVHRAFFSRLNGTQKERYQSELVPA